MENDSLVTRASRKVVNEVKRQTSRISDFRAFIGMRKVDNFYKYYEWIKPLGGGQFGEVNLAKNK